MGLHFVRTIYSTAAVNRLKKKIKNTLNYRNFTIYATKGAILKSGPQGHNTGAPKGLNA